MPAKAASFVFLDGSHSISSVFPHYVLNERWHEGPSSPQAIQINVQYWIAIEIKMKWLIDPCQKWFVLRNQPLHFSYFLSLGWRERHSIVLTINWIRGQV